MPYESMVEIPKDLLRKLVDLSQEHLGIGTVTCMFRTDAVEAVDTAIEFLDPGAVKMSQTDVTAQVHEALKDDQRTEDGLWEVSYDGDNEDAEIIITMGGEDWIIKPRLADR